MPGVSLTPTNAVYNPVTGELQLTVPNHGLTGGVVLLQDRSIFFTCSRDDFRTVHPYPRPTDPASGQNLAVTKITDDIFLLSPSSKPSFSINDPRISVETE